MYYAICPKHDDKWVILRGWDGCQVGDGEVIARELSNLETSQRLQELNDIQNLIKTEIDHNPHQEGY